MEAVDITSEQIEEEEDHSFINDTFFNVLGLISLGFIESMTTFSGGGKKEPLAEIVATYLNITPKKVDAQTEKNSLDEPEPQELGKAKILPFSKDGANSSKETETDKSTSTSSFIFKEKKRSEHVQRKIKGREIIEAYQKSSEVNVKQEKALRDDLSKSYKVGVLINKRQY